MNNSLFPAAINQNVVANGHRISTEIRKLKKDSLWLTLHRDPARNLHNFSPALLAELQGIIGHLKDTEGKWHHDMGVTEIGYIVIKSSDPDYFSVGGDLRFFRDCIAERNHDALHEYSTRCLELLGEWSNLLKDRTTSISLVQGRALGGGFEMALSADYIVAEEQSTFGFPEIMFGLFPCTGAMGLLTRRIGAVRAERMMTNNKIYTARELLELGVIDEVCAQGKGERVVEDYIARHANRQKAHLRVQQSRMRCAPLDLEEGKQIVEDWVNLALCLEPEEIRALEMLIMLQEGGRVRDAERKAA